MSYLVTGAFYDRREAQRAVDRLLRQSIPKENIYLETAAATGSEPEAPRGPLSVLKPKRRFESAAARERRMIGLATGLIIGPTVGCLAGVGIGALGAAIENLTDSQGKLSLLANPLIGAIVGGLGGLVAGGLIAWFVEYVLTRLGLAPTAPADETLVTVRCEETVLDQVCGSLVRGRAHRVDVSTPAFA